MHQSNIHLLDLPNEILLIILKKLDNIDILYSLFGINNNKRLDILLKASVFTNILNFVTISSITDVKLDRFCAYILPRNYHYIKKTRSPNNMHGTYSSCWRLSKLDFSRTLQFWTRHNRSLFST
jgi:hypothetical protein